MFQFSVVKLFVFMLAEHKPGRASCDYIWRMSWQMDFCEAWQIFSYSKEIEVIKATEHTK